MLVFVIFVIKTNAQKQQGKFDNFYGKKTVLFVLRQQCAQGKWEFFNIVLG